MQSSAGQCGVIPSLPVRGAWIEISMTMAICFSTPSLPVRGAWIEIFRKPLRHCEAESLPVRGAWIEMLSDQMLSAVHIVAPRAGSVD